MNDKFIGSVVLWSLLASMTVACGGAPEDEETASVEQQSRLEPDCSIFNPNPPPECAFRPTPDPLPPPPVDDPPLTPPPPPPPPLPPPQEPPSPENCELSCSQAKWECNLKAGSDYWACHDEEIFCRSRCSVPVNP